MQAFWTNDCSRFDPILLRVGDRLFHTSRDVLLSHSNSFFSGMLSDNFKTNGADEPYFIPRDGDVFEHILRFLVYDDLPPLSDFMLRQLIKDADFYGLDALKEKVAGLEGATAGVEVNAAAGDVIALRVWWSTRYPRKGLWLCKAEEADARFYKVIRASDDVDSVVIVQSGSYVINMNFDHRTLSPRVVCNGNRHNAIISRVVSLQRGDILSVVGFNTMAGISADTSGSVVIAMDTQPGPNVKRG
ncbi:EF-hand domain-containing protein 1 [Irineochytrium annulatum]|nr:EF-hand domain-containing protein 1 [Irineochytrium annulatum]